VRDVGRCRFQANLQEVPLISARIRHHIRSNAIGYLALFVALSGTAYATHPGGANTISTVDIQNGEVKKEDIGAGEVTAGDIGVGAVNRQKLGRNAVTSEKVLDEALTADDIAFNTLRGDEILEESLGGNDIAGDSLSGEDVNESTLFNDNSLTTADLANDSVGKGELGPNAVGASELYLLVDRPDPTPTLIGGGAEHNGAYNTAQSTASCNADEQLIGGYGKWANVPNLNAELFISGMSLDHTAGSVTVTGGNDSGDDSSLVAVATCLQP
jgi:hypothetical protein